MALLSAQASANASGDLEDVVMYEKNTFLTLEVVPRSRRTRTSVSVPATLRVAAQDLVSDTLAKKRASPSIRAVASLGAMSAASTKSPLDSDASSDSQSTAGASVARDVAEEELDAGKVAAAAASRDVSSHAQGPAKVLLCELIAPPSAPQRPRLRTNARAFVSATEAAARQRWDGRQFRAQVESMVAATQSALLAMGTLASVCLTQSAGTWTLCARILPGCERHAGTILPSAKNALVRRVEQSTGIYMLGYLAEPFTHGANSFTVTLCDMKDGDAACWDYYSKGFCRRGCSCKWAHPAEQLTVRVEVRR